MDFFTMSWDFYKTVIERKIVADRVLPGREPLLVVWKPGANKLTDTVEGQALPWGLDDSHGDHSYVGVGRLHHLAPLFCFHIHFIAFIFFL